MSDKYEKHQRDYTILASTIICESIFNKKNVDYFSYKPKHILLLIEKGVFSHFFRVKDYSGWPTNWMKKYALDDFKKFIKLNDLELIKYHKFLKRKPGNLIEGINQLHDYIAYFMPIIMLAAWLPAYSRIKPSKAIIGLALKTKIKYENVHRNGMEKEKKLLNMLERKWKIKKDTLKNLTCSEFKNFVQTKKLPKKTEQRNDFMLIEHRSQGPIVLAKNKAFTLLKKIDDSKRINKSLKELRGNIGYPGKVKGKARKIELIEQSKNIKSGEILVASMTDPRYLPAMRKAAAFVTNEGGITCHAAIVAREMKKPCVIGTKYATSIFKNGDKILVDANNGIVKKV